MILEARGCQGDINHITGDIHFISFLLKPRRTVLTIHDCGFMNHSSALARFLFRWCWLKIPVHLSAVVTVVSQSTKREVLKYVNCKPEKIQVIPNFVSSVFQPHLKAFNQVLPTILHVGTAPNKNLERLVEAIASIPCRLIVIGKLSGQQFVWLKQHNINYANIFNASQKDVIEAYLECDLLSFISTTEGFGLPILEAQAVGRPVVTSNLSSMPEVAGEAACFVNPFDVISIRQGISKVIRDDHYRNELIKAGLSNVQRFKKQAIVDKYVSLYEEVLSANKES